MDQTLRALNRFGLGARRDERQTDRRSARLAAGAARRRSAVAARAGGRIARRRLATRLRGLRMPGQGNEQERREARRQRGRDRHRRSAARRSPHASPAIDRSSSGSSRSGPTTSASRPAPRSSSRRWPAATSATSSGRTCSAASRTWCWRRRSIRRCSSYLDNFQSIGPTSRGARARAARNSGQRRGLNENYARELLELHTLGVNGGYTQQDVQELAKILTGWTIDGIGGPAIACRSARNQDRGGAAAARRRRRAPRAGRRRSASSFRSCCTSRAARRCSGSATARPASRKASARFARCAVIRPRRSSSPPSWSRTSSATSRRQPPSIASRGCSVERRRSEGRRARARRRARGLARGRAEVPHAAGLVRRRAARVRHQRRAARTRRRCCGSSGSRSGRRRRRRDSATRCRNGPIPTRCSIAASWRARSRGCPALRALDPRSLLDVVDVPAGNPLHALLADTSIPAPERIALAVAGPAFQWR